VVVVDFTNNAKQILKAFAKYRKGTPFEPTNRTRPLPKLRRTFWPLGSSRKGCCRSAYADQDGDGCASTISGEYFADALSGQAHDWEDRKAFVYLLARFVKSFHFLTCFFTTLPRFRSSQLSPNTLVRSSSRRNCFRADEANSRHSSQQGGGGYQGVMTGGAQ